MGVSYRTEVRECVEPSRFCVCVTDKSASDLRRDDSEYSNPKFVGDRMKTFVRTPERFVSSRSLAGKYWWLPMEGRF